MAATHELAWYAYRDWRHVVATSFARHLRDFWSKRIGQPAVSTKHKQKLRTMIIIIINTLQGKPKLESHGCD